MYSHLYVEPYQAELALTCAEVSTVMVMVNNRIDLLKPSLRLDLARISCDALLYILYRSDIIS